MILYFSGTGNSRYLAEIIQKNTGDDLISLNERIKAENYNSIYSEKPLVFVVPTYAWQIPHIVRDFILRTEFKGNKMAYFILTCGVDTGNASHFTRLLCKHKNFKYMGLRTIVMPENYIALYSAPSRKMSAKLISAAVPKAAGAANYILKEKRLPLEKAGLADKAKSSLVNNLFYKFVISATGFYATDKCIGCGMCSKLCILNNIKLVNSKPVWGDKCTHCMACINACPTKAIEYKHNTKYKRRYYCTRTVK
ncbi:MAG: EFR1 family ferrodoxin [Candidatus Metalachnospira sp.]|nr:EFR1 family ferrodoxin [Candidatus Metalachnospira sp.]